MIKALIALCALLTVAVTSYAAPRKRPVRSSARPAAANSAKKTPAGKSRSRRYTPAYARRNFQSTPSPERYRDIQQALTAKGYYKGNVNGEWGSDSVDALKRFQADQNLDVDGKIGSLSLIALGLGPKRTTAQVRPEQPAVQPNPPAPNKQP